MLSETVNIPQNIFHIQPEYGIYMGIFYRTLSVSQNILNNVMLPTYYIRKVSNVVYNGQRGGGGGEGVTLPFLSTILHHFLSFWKRWVGWGWGNNVLYVWV
jgi:hypothetical protein